MAIQNRWCRRPRPLYGRRYCSTNNEICDITASLLTEVCHNVATEPPLQPLTGELFSARSVNTSNHARPDIRARGFWNNHQDAFFYVRVFYHNAPSNHSGDVYRRHEQARIRTKGQRNRAWSLHTPSPLNLGRNGQGSSNFLADLLASKRQNPYPAVMGWLRCRAAIICIYSLCNNVHPRKLLIHRPVYTDNITLEYIGATYDISFVLFPHHHLVLPSCNFS